MLEAVREEKSASDQDSTAVSIVVKPPPVQLPPQKVRNNVAGLKRTKVKRMPNSISASLYNREGNIIEKSKYSPFHTRDPLSVEYEEEKSGREHWWRTNIKETPLPGAYNTHENTFLRELAARTNTYRFKSAGRVLDPQPWIGKGGYLMPGAYGFQDIAYCLEKDISSYGFRRSDRDASDVLNFGKKDKDIDISPNAYEMEKYLSMSSERSLSKHPAFKSQIRRFPTVQFVPRKGPGPGDYEYNAPPSAQYCSSSFKSRTPRFVTSHKKTPGPGTYDSVFQHPPPETISKMGRQHGLFFTSQFQA